MAYQGVLRLLALCALTEASYSSFGQIGADSSDVTYWLDGFMDGSGYEALSFAGEEFGVNFHFVSGCYLISTALEDSVRKVNALADSILTVRKGVGAPQKMWSRVRELHTDFTLTDSVMHQDPQFLAVLDSLKNDFSGNLLKVDYFACGENCYHALVRVGKPPEPFPVVKEMEFIVDRERGLARRR